MTSTLPPRLQGCEQHKQIGGAVALVLIIVPGWLSGHWRDCDTSLCDELLRCLVQADDRAIRIMGSLTDFQDILYGRYESGIGLRDNPLLLQMQLECVFEHAPDCVVAGAIDDFQFHHSSFQQRQRPPLMLFWWRGTGERDQLGFSGTVEDGPSTRWSVRIGG